MFPTLSGILERSSLPVWMVAAYSHHPARVCISVFRASLREHHLLGPSRIFPGHQQEMGGGGLAGGAISEPKIL